MLTNIEVSSLALDSNGQLYAGGISRFSSSDFGAVWMYDGTTSWSIVGNAYVSNNSYSVNSILFDGANRLYAGGRAGVPTPAGLWVYQ